MADPLAAVVVAGEVDPAVGAKLHLDQIPAGGGVGTIFPNAVEVVGVDGTEIPTVEADRVGGKARRCVV